jgi:hypothetical protein
LPEWLVMRPLTLSRRSTVGRVYCMFISSW